LLTGGRSRVNEILLHRSKIDDKLLLLLGFYMLHCHIPAPRWVSLEEPADHVGALTTPRGGRAVADPIGVAKLLKRRHPREFPVKLPAGERFVELLRQLEAEQLQHRVRLSHARL
jgi:hypothetical protein